MRAPDALPSVPSGLGRYVLVLSGGEAVVHSMSTTGDRGLAGAFNANVIRRSLGSKLIRMEFATPEEKAAAGPPMPHGDF